MKIENIDIAKDIKDDINRLNNLLESNSISNVVVVFYDKTGYKRQVVLTDKIIFEVIKQTVKDEKDRLENKLNELL